MRVQTKPSTLALASQLADRSVLAIQLAEAVDTLAPRQLRSWHAALKSKMYENWTCKRWETPVSDRSTSMESLTDADGLEIVVNASNKGERPFRYKFFFRKPAGYRNLLEEYRTELWNMFSKSSHPGSTFVVENSPWIAEIAAREPLLMVHDRGVAHYVIATDNDVVEVLSSQPPTISPLSE